MNSEILPIDFQNIAYILSSHGRLHTKGLSGYIGSLVKLSGVNQYCVVDDCTPYKRKEEFPNYKRKRKNTPTKFEGKLNIIRSEFPILRVEGLEADDLVGSFVRNPFFTKVVGVSNDSDLTQYGIFSKYQQLDPKSRQIKNLTQKQALKVLVTKILKGDLSSDSIPKCHNNGKIVTNKFDTAFEEIFQKVRNSRVTDFSKFPLDILLFEVFSKYFDICPDMFERNFNIINLVQGTYGMESDLTLKQIKPYIRSK